MPYVLIFCFPLKSNCKAFQKEWPWLSFTKTNVYEMYGRITSNMATAINLLPLLLLIKPCCNIWYEYNGNGYRYVHCVNSVQIEFVLVLVFLYSVYVVIASFIALFPLRDINSFIHNISKTYLP